MACIGGILLFVAVNMVKPAEVRQVLAHNRFHIALMVYTAVMVIVTDFLTGVLSAIIIWAVLTASSTSRRWCPARHAGAVTMRYFERVTVALCQAPVDADLLRYARMLGALGRDEPSLRFFTSCRPSTRGNETAASPDPAHVRQCAARGDRQQFGAVPRRPSRC